MRLGLFLSLVCLVSFTMTAPVRASGGGAELPEMHWHFDGMLGQYDKAALQRGYKVYSQVCSACHSMERVYFRNLSALGYNEDEIKAIASEYSVQDGPDDEGEMFDRSALPSDAFPSPYPNRKAAMYANNGAFPPDMSLLVHARPGGATYVYSVLTGYDDGHHGDDLLPGQHWNKYMPGHIIAMAPPLSDGLVAYEDGSPETVKQYAKDVSEFLAWASDPHLEARKKTGVKVLFFLLIFTGVLYGVKKKVWANAH